MIQKTKEKIKLAREKNKPKLLFECKDYTIEKIPLNYRIMIKCAKKNVRQGINRDWYSDDDRGIKEAHGTADFAIKEFFRKRVKPINPFSSK